MVASGLGIRGLAFPVVIGSQSGSRIGVHVVVDLERVACRSVGLMAGAVTWAFRVRKVRGRGRGLALGLVVVVVVVASRLGRPWRWSVHDSDAFIDPARCGKCRSSALLGVLAKTESWRHRPRLRQGFISSGAGCLAVTSSLCLPDVTSLYAAGITCATSLASFSWGQPLKVSEGRSSSPTSPDTPRHKGNGTSDMCLEFLTACLRLEAIPGALFPLRLCRMVG